MPVESRFESQFSEISILAVVFCSYKGCVVLVLPPWLRSSIFFPISATQFSSAFYLSFDEYQRRESIRLHSNDAGTAPEKISGRGRKGVRDLERGSNAHYSSTIYISISPKRGGPRGAKFLPGKPMVPPASPPPPLAPSLQRCMAIFPSFL